MAAPLPNNRESNSNPQKKILEDLQLKKQLFLKQGVSQTLAPSSTTTQATGWQSGTDGHIAGSGGAARTAQLPPTAHSLGYFITQDSAFGNTILPVLPRVEATSLKPSTTLKQLESALQQVSGFERPKISLEQYETPAHIAARLVYTAQNSYEDITGKIVADLGCGCGVLSLGALLMGAHHLVGFDIDSKALEACRSTLEELREEEQVNAELLQVDVTQLIVQPRLAARFDTVILNPPFGTRGKPGADIAFLQAAAILSSHAVYSLHKTSTRAHVLRRAQQFGLKGEVLAELRYDLPKTYSFHKHQSVDIQVDFIRFIKDCSR